MWGGYERRGVSEVLGAILVFAILVSGVALYQVTVVPQTNEEREVEHSQQIRSQMLDLRNDIQAAATTGRTASTSVNLGAEYPVRALTLNPPEGGGSLRTVGTRDDDVAVRLYNAKAIDTDTDDYLNGSEVVLPSGVLTYTPNYNYYRESPRTVYENTVLVQQFPGANIARSDQELVNGRHISLVTLAGQRAESESGTVSVQARPVSPATETVIVESSSGPINITIPTTLSEEYWVQELLAQQIDSEYAGATNCADLDGPAPSNDDNDGQYVVDCSYTSPPGPTNELNITLQQAAGDQPVRYALEMSKVGVGPEATNPKPAYLTALEGDGADVALDGRQEVVFQARDKYNNPATEQTIDVKLNDQYGGTLYYRGMTVSDISDPLPVGPDGKLALVYDAPLNTSTSPANVSIEANFSTIDYDEDTPQSASVDIDVVNASRIDRTQPLFNPTDTLVVEDAVFTDGDCNGDGKSDSDCDVSITFENTGGSEATVTKLRYTFFASDSQGASGASFGASFGVYKLAGNDQSVTLELAGDSKPITPATVGSDNQATLKLYALKDSSPQNLDEGEYFVISAIVNGERRTYFVAPTAGDNDNGAKNKGDDS